MYMSAMPACTALCQKTTSDSTIDGLSHVVAGNWTEDLWKNRQYSEPLSYLSSPNGLF